MTDAYIKKVEPVISDIKYNYSNTWLDQLESIEDITYNSNGIELKAYSYDEQGNPTGITNFMFQGVQSDHAELTYLGRQLESITVYSDATTILASISYGYNDQGYRVSKKIVEGITSEITDYFLLGNKVLSETVTTVENSIVVNLYRIVYTYDADSTLISFNVDTNLQDSYQGIEYFYVHNLQGDITAIIDVNSNILVEYTYDTWGNLLDIVDNSNNQLSSLNPYTYRGYRYDSEISLYYLNSRYYDSSIHRFINADGLLGEIGNVGSTNMFAYCANNPVMYSDPSGNFAISTFLIMFAVSALATWAAGELFGHQLVGGIGSTANGVGAISTGVSLMAFGPWGISAGIVLIGIGAATAAFGVNEIVDHFTGTNSIQSWGMSDSLYNGLYIGLNIASGVGQIAGNLGMRYASDKILNSIVQNPSKVQNYSLWQMKTYGRYTTQYAPGVMQRSTSNPGGGYTLTNKTNIQQGYIQWHPGGSRWHFGGASYWKVTSSYNKAWRGLYLF